MFLQITRHRLDSPFFTGLNRRSIEVKAPPARIFALINDLHGWAAWSPYEKKDPDMKRTFSGSPAGKGAVYEWDGNNSVGKGRMEIIDAVVPSKVTIKLDFIKPFEGHNIADFILVPRGDTTEVTWLMHGPTPFVSKLMQVFVNMDTMIGKDFETGLANLKAMALVELFGEKGFVYAGNDRSDLVVWRRAKGAIVVNATRSVFYHELIIPIGPHQSAGIRSRDGKPGTPIEYLLRYQ
jgi:hypothetical protein